MFATQSEAHREWHLNSGVPMGQPGCPQDACHPVEDHADSPDAEPWGVRCGNVAYHGREQKVYHADAAAVRECYAHSGRFGEAVLVSGQVLAEAQQAHNTRMSGLRAAAEGVWHSTGPQAHEGHWESQCPGASCPVMSLPSSSVEEAVAQMRANLSSPQARNAERYAAWATIPVGEGDYANYALATSQGVVLYQVQRPSTGKWAGKTYVKRHSGDGLVKMEWVQAGAALDSIAADPMAAAVLYGRSSKRCAICHRKLTDGKTKGPDGLTSLERGIGPKCAKRMVS